MLIELDTTKRKQNYLGRGLYHVSDVSEFPSRVPKVPSFPFVIGVPTIPTQRLSHLKPTDKIKISFLIDNTVLALTDSRTLVCYCISFMTNLADWPASAKSHRQDAQVKVVMLYS
jgi:hypothetical protein